MKDKTKFEEKWYGKYIQICLDNEIYPNDEIPRSFLLVRKEGKEERKMPQLIPEEMDEAREVLVNTPNRRIREMTEEVVELCKVYFIEGNLTTSDFQGCLEGIINKYKEN